MKTGIDWAVKYRALENVPPFVIREIQSEAYNEGKGDQAKIIHETVLACAESAKIKSYDSEMVYYLRVDKDSILSVEQLMIKKYLTKWKRN